MPYIPDLVGFVDLPQFSGSTVLGNALQAWPCPINKNLDTTFRLRTQGALVPYFHNHAQHIHPPVTGMQRIYRLENYIFLIG